MRWYRPLGLVVLLVGLVLVAGLLLGSVGVQSDFKGRAERSAALCPEDMVWISAGSFLAGATAEEVQLAEHDADIVRDPRPRDRFVTEDYCIDKYEWPGRGRRPVADVTWLQARVACEAVGKRLCAEDEWVKACGGVLGWNQPYGPIRVVGLCHSEVFEEGAYDRVVPSGSSPGCRSPWGTWDQEGNVSEWVEGARAPDSLDRWVLGGTMWPGVYGRGCQARHAHPEVAPVSGDDGFRCCRRSGP
ncbi:MAG: SUMF1/EgtB/PvdO family nonheme iron enzyme [Myxococcota bacterium]|nr:SUMF1/EgtB/PvdO family nonheme iron enzyme [Myxococcota bacterium]